jgi:hypothetical protein
MTFHYFFGSIGPRSNLILNPNGAKVEDAQDPRRPRANAVCCCEAAANYMRALGMRLLASAGDMGILLFC